MAMLNLKVLLAAVKNSDSAVLYKRYQNDESSFIVSTVILIAIIHQPVNNTLNLLNYIKTL